jgi:hypothetical protein
MSAWRYLSKNRPLKQQAKQPVKYVQLLVEKRLLWNVNRRQMILHRHHRNQHRNHRR